MMDSVLMEGIGTMPIGWQAWVNWMMLINTLSIVFVFKHIPARFALGVWIPNAITMMWMAEHFGYVRLLGLSHIIWWTPLVGYLFLKRKDFDLATWFGRWAIVLLVTNSLSLVVDYVDVFRYLAGDQDDQRPVVTEPEEVPETPAGEDAVEPEASEQDAWLRPGSLGTRAQVASKDMRVQWFAGRKA